MIDAAIIEFADKGLYGTATEDIARRAGISQPYIFRLFGTKKDLFLAASERICRRIVEIFEASAGSEGPGTVLDRMGQGFTTLLTQRVELLMMLQAFVGTQDEDVRAVMQARMQEIFALVKRLSGEDDWAVRSFVAYGMLLAVLRACDMPQALGATSWEEVVATDVCPETFRHLVL